MTQEILDIYQKHNNFRFTNVTPATDCIFMPYLLMDIVRDIYTHEIATAPLKFQLNHWSKEWKKSYNKFNTRFFRPFNVDQSLEITNKMDDLEEFLQNDLVELREAIIEIIGGTDTINKKLYVSSLIANIITRSAINIWTRHYDKLYFPPDVNLVGVYEATAKIMKITYPKKQVFWIKGDRLDKATTMLSKHMVQWAFKDVGKHNP